MTTKVKKRTTSRRVKKAVPRLPSEAEVSEAMSRLSEAVSRLPAGPTPELRVEVAEAVSQLGEVVSRLETAFPTPPKGAVSRLKETALQDRFTDLLDRLRAMSRTELGEAGLHPTPPKEAVSRLEARIPISVYQAMERAAQLRGLTLTAYVTATMGEDARRTIEEADIIRLSRADQIAFAKALINPPEPNAKLLAAKRRHHELTGK